MSRKGRKIGEGARVDIPASECELHPVLGIPAYIKDKRGHTFDRLTVKEFAGFQLTPDGKRLAIWGCQCTCGKSININTRNIGKAIKSCGCLHSEIHTTHGVHRTDSDPLMKKSHESWRNMIARCTDPKHPKWQWYGGRGIAVCDRWLHSFETFLEDMSTPTTAKHSLDRIDNSLGYSPENCKWSTSLEQANNTRRNRILPVGLPGTPNKSVAEFSREMGVPYKALLTRLNNGMTPYEALFHYQRQQHLRSKGQPIKNALYIPAIIPPTC